MIRRMQIVHQSRMNQNLIRVKATWVEVSHDQENEYLFQRLRSMSRLHKILRSLQFYFRNCIDLCIQENIIAVLFSLPAPEECRLATHTLSRLQQMCLTHVYHKTMAAVLLTLDTERQWTEIVAIIINVYRIITKM